LSTTWLPRPPPYRAAHPGPAVARGAAQRAGRRALGDARSAAERPGARCGPPPPALRARGSSPPPCARLQSVSAAALRCANEHVLELQAEHVRLAALLTGGRQAACVLRGRAAARRQRRRAVPRGAQAAEAAHGEAAALAGRGEGREPARAGGDLGPAADPGGRGARGVGRGGAGGAGEEAHAAAYAAARPVTAPISLTSPSRSGPLCAAPSVLWGARRLRPEPLHQQPTPYGSPAGGGARAA